MRQLLLTFGASDTDAWLDAAQSGLRIVLILVLAWLAVAGSQKLIRTLRMLIQRRVGDHEEAKRIETLGRVFRYIAAVVISVVAGSLVLNELGISIAPILGAAGVVGVAVGFGAQSLIKDYFNGFFLLLENQLRQGDVVEAGGKSGLVEEITLRYLRLRDYEGHVHYVPNGTVTTVTNMSRGYAQSLIDVGIAYREDIDQAFEVMRRVGAEMRANADFGARILDELEIAGVDRWEDSSVILRCRFKVKPLEQWAVRREYLRRLKRAFDAAGIEIPYPHLTIYAGQARDGTAPAFRIDNREALAGPPAGRAA